MKKILPNQNLKRCFSITFLFFALSIFVQAQGTKINGMVVDADNEPVIGGTVLVKDQASGTSTDIDGKFELKVNEQATVLVFSYVGLQTVEVPINGQTTINVTLPNESLGLDEVVVTARKKSENLQVVPISVAAFSAKSLKSRGIGNVSQIGDFIPNVEIDVNAPFSGSQSVLSPFIRGIGQVDFAITYEPAVGLYVDGVYYGRTVGSVIDMLDVERVEALKGPQGTLFGRNTIGGAINITTKRPSLFFSTNAEITTGSYNRLDTKVSVDIPLVKEKLLTSFSVSSVNRGGYMKRLPFTGEHNGDLATPGDEIFSDVDLDQDQGNQNNDTWRAKVLWIGSDNFEATLTADYARVRENQNASKIIDIFGEFNGGPTIVGAYNACAGGFLPPELCNDIAGAPGLELIGRTPFDERFITKDPFTNYATADAGSKIDSWGTALTLDWDITENIELKSITSYRNLKSQFAEDQDFAPISFGRAGFIMPQEQFTQELQLTGITDKLKWIGGLYHFREDGSVTDQVVLGNGLVQIYGQNFIENQSYAAFAQATYNFTDKWSITGGLRYTNEKKTLDGRQRDLNSFVLKTGGVTPDDFPTSDLTLYYPEGVNEQTFSVPTFRIGTEYKFSEKAFAYGFMAQGFKSGGWTTRVTTPVKVAPTFEPEKANTYEVGLKTNLADYKFRFNLAAFYTDYQDLQVTVQRGITPFVENAAAAEIKGLEVDVMWRATPGLILSGNFGYIDAKYKEITDENALISEDSKFLNTPDFSSSVALDYTVPLGKGKEKVIFHVDVNNKGEIYNDVENTPLLRQPGLTLLNASVSLESRKENWRITLGGSNLTNETYIVGGYSNPGVGITYATYARPAEFNLGISFNF